MSEEINTTEFIEEALREWDAVETSPMETERMMRVAASRISDLSKICAATYQLAGLVGAPVRFLDALSRHELKEELLPVFDHEVDACAVNQWVSVDDRLPPHQSAIFWSPLMGLPVVEFVDVREWPELISDEGYIYWLSILEPPPKLT